MHSCSSTKLIYSLKLSGHVTVVETIQELFASKKRLSLLMIVSPSDCNVLSSAAGSVVVLTNSLSWPISCVVREAPGDM